MTFQPLHKIQAFRVRVVKMIIARSRTLLNFGQERSKIEKNCITQLKSDLCLSLFSEKKRENSPFFGTVQFVLFK